MLGPVLARCDEDGVRAYLESSKEQNIPFYRRHGFEVTGEVRLPGGPPVWTMRASPGRRAERARAQREGEGAGGWRPSGIDPGLWTTS